MNKLIIRTGKVESIKRYHPWIFSGAVKNIEGEPKEGEWVEVYDNHNNFLAMAQYSAKGSIIARVISYQKEYPSVDFYKNKIATAKTIRETINLPLADITNAFRLIYGEADGLPGLIIDFYNYHIVVETHTSGMYNDIQLISNALQELFGNELKSIFVIDKSQNLKNSFYTYKIADISLPIIIKENGNSFYINWEEGQKTGFYIDQRDNRELLQRYAKAKTVLNMFCYTGAFSVYAAKGGADRVISVDSSAEAIQLVNKNLELNQIDAKYNEPIREEAISYLNNMPKDYFDLIILDPPAFAKSIDARHNAIKGYKRINSIAIEKVKHNGIIFTFSCSQAVSPSQFEGAIMSAAIEQGRKIRILHRLTQAPCHAPSLFHSEGYYLKGLVLLVE